MREDLFAELYPAVQLFYFLFVIFVSIFIPHPTVIACSFLGAVAYCICLRGWRRVFYFQILCMLPVMLFVIAINGLFSHYGVTPLYYLRTGAITLESLVYGAVLAFMLWTSLMWFSVINEIMTMDRWVFLLGRCSPMLSLALSIILRFIPRCRRQYHKMREGRESFGVQEEKRCWGKMKNGAKQLSMLFTWSLESGTQMADSMRARCYGVNRRTSYANYRMEPWDWSALLLFAALAFACVVGFLHGYGKALYNPAIQVEAVGADTGSIITYICWIGFCFLPTVSRGIQEMRRRRWEKGGARQITSETGNESYVDG